MFLFIPYFVAPACVSQQSAFQRALIKNANNVRFTSAAPQRPESEREGEEETLSHPVETECVRRRETGVHRKKKEPRVRGEKKEKREMEGGKKARRQSRYYVCGDTAALV